MPGPIPIHRGKLLAILKSIEEDMERIDFVKRHGGLTEADLRTLHHAYVHLAKAQEPIIEIYRKLIGRTANS